jgi:hypothetical protein
MSTRRNRVLQLMAALAVAGSTLTGVLVMGSAGATGTPTLDPANFTDPQSNRWFPLTPGLVLRYRGSEDGERFRERVRFTHRTKLIQGVRARVVVDVLRRADGTLAEKTHDWYANDNSGNVWYLGEATATYEADGSIESREGSWQAGRDGAKAGLIMPAGPRPTNAYRQELYKQHAEDQAWIVQSHATARVPRGTFHHVVRSFEWTRLEKHVLSMKLYARDVGLIAERDVAGGKEVFRLVKIVRPVAPAT